MTATAVKTVDEIDFIAEFIERHGRGGDENRGTRIVMFIREYLDTYGSSPSIREIGEAVGLRSTSGVHHQLLALEKAGAITRRPNLARSIVIPQQRVAA